MSTAFTDIPAAELPEVLDMVIWEISGRHPVETWRKELLARPDAESEDVRRAIAVIDEYLAPESSPEALTAQARAWPDTCSSIEHIVPVSLQG